ncbi:MAG: phosphoserine phosphatase SerB, partial [Pseudomonadota bacterium]
MIISMIAKPGELKESAVEGLADQLDGQDLTWLAEDEAAEFTLPADPGPLYAEGIDINVLPETGRKKRLLIADMDSTMIEQECIDEMAAHAGIGEKVAAITALAMDGKLGFEEAMEERVALIKGLPLTALEAVFEERLTFMAGGATLLATMRAHGAHTALVSGGFTFFTERVAGRLGFHEHRANTLLHDGTALTGAVAPPILGREAKVEALEELSARLSLSEDDALAVGDGANDLGMLGRAGLGVA